MNLIERTHESKTLNIFIASTRETDKPYAVIVERNGIRKTYPAATVGEVVRMSEYVNDRLYVIV